ncbi:hypothetical protein [Edaphobacter flagellatus]|uniref:hypothetical protein n=1 Tax=Edaphobacter flagellatus TaxID=1933044 RepID=UPI0021B440A5|nr:hypothetical protein [Edaphobacter flagellatus]
MKLAHLLVSLTLLLPGLPLSVAQSPPSSPPKPTPQNPSPMTESSRAHKRLTRIDVPGKRVDLSSGTLLIPNTARPQRAMPLYIHFHGAPWVAEQSIHAVNPRAAIITFNLGAGSGVYSRAFHDPARFQQLLREAAKAIDPSHPPEFKPIVLSSFSAGYGAIREILKNRDNLSAIDRIVLVDSLHTGYLPDGAPGPLDPAPLEPFLAFAREALAGRKIFVFTHSEIFPGTFASTTETADYLITTLSLQQHPVLKWGPGGMQQLSDVHVKGLHILGFAGNTAPDHIDQFHGLEQWLRMAK